MYYNHKIVNIYQCRGNAMATIISLALQKGGSAKTTTAVNLSAELQAKGKRVLLIDMDSQANSSFSFIRATTPWLGLA